jgi:phenylacetic acid degradation operon negative regulatory protein
VSLTAIVNEGAQLGSGRPRALIVTIYGLYARESGGWVSVSSLIRLMRELSIEEPAVRSSISRLKRRGILEAERRDGQAGYALSPRARHILEEGDRRIFDRPRATLEDGWVLAVFSVPESERRQRHTLRSRLTWLGYGTVSAGVWIAPRHLEAETRDVLERYGLSSYVDLFSSGYLGFADLGKQVEQWWDLESLQELYASFHAAHTPVLRRWKRRTSVAGADAFADYVRALTAWRHLPFLDPGLPPELLPGRWKGAAAADLFVELRDRLADPAHDYARSVVG